MRNVLKFLFIFLCTTTWAQQYNFINYNVEEGLAQSQVSDLAQDAGGYLWIATRGGLSRFDGMKFTNYSKNQGLISNQLSDLFIDNENKLWVGAEGGISLYDNTKFLSFQFKEEFSKYQVNDMALANDTLYIGTNGGGVIRFANNQFYYPGDEGLLNVRSIDFFNEQLLAGTRNGVYKIHKGKNPERIAALEFTNDMSISVVYAKNDKLYIGSYSGDGVFEFDPSFQQTNHFTTQKGMINDRVRAILNDNQSNNWMVSKTGIIKISNGEITNFTSQNGLPHDNINCVLQDNDGNMWFGTDGKGICLFTGEAFVNYQQKDGLSSDFVMSIVEDTMGDLWFSTYGGGITHWNSGKPKSYSMVDGLTNNTVWTSLRDRNGILWFGSSSGVMRYIDGQFQQLELTGEQKSTKVTYLFEDDEGKIWIGGQYGVWIYDDGKIVFQQVKDEIKGNNIRAIEEDHKNNIWLGSQIGLYQYKNGRYEYVKVLQSDEALTVYCLKYTHNQLWVGTNNGLFVSEKEHFKKVQLSDNFNANTINFLLPFQNNQMWVGTNNGIYKIELSGNEDYKVFHYNTNDGLKSLECNLNASYEDSEDHLWFGTGGGLLKYNPKLGDQLKELNEPKIHITGIRLFLEEMDYLKYSDGIDPKTGLPENLVLPFHKNHLTFDFIGISLKSPESIKYKYRLQGFDSEWSPATSSPLATYSNLPFGEYTFLIMATNKSGVWSEPVSYSFVILPPFWRTWWFYGICFVTISLIVYLIITIRARVVARKRATQQLVYKSKLAALEQQSLNASMNRHFIFNALNSIQYFINTSDKISANRYLTNFAKLIRKNLDSTTTENYIVALQEEIDRIQLYLSLESMRFENKFEYTIDIDENLDTEIINVPSMMLQPFIENGIIHGILPKDEKGHIILKIYKNKNQVVFEIEDDGVGIDNSIQNKTKFEGDEGHISKGMKITSSRITLLQKITEKDISIEGPYQLKNDKKYPGTKVIIRLPLN